MPFEIFWDDKVLADLDKLEVIIARRIIKKVAELAENPFAKDIKKLKGCEEFRVRVGDYRIVLEIEGNKINIVKVGHRKNIYDF